MKKIITRTITFLLMLALAGCATPLYQRTSNNIAGVRGQIAAAKNSYQDAKPPVVTKRGLYFNAEPHKISHAPAWLNNKVSVYGTHLPLDFYVSKILAGTNADVSYQSSALAGQMLSWKYSGTIRGALNSLATLSGYAYTLDDNTIMWSNMITRTFDISFMPGTAQYAVGGEMRSTSVSPTSGNAIYFGDLSSNRNQYSNLTGDVSVWRDLRETLDKLKSKDGHVVVSQATTTVTVSDHPHNVETIARYLTRLNSELSREVALQIRVLEISLNKNFNYGIDWNLVRKVMGARIGLTGSLSQVAGVNPLGNNPTPAVAGVIINGLASSDWAGTRLLINALKQQGNVSIVTEPRVVTLNNQVAEIGINRLTGYLESVSTTFTGVTSQFATESLTPGVVKTGFSLYILPKVENNKIYLQISSNISNLANIQRIGPNSINGASDTGNNSGNNVNSSEIQVPTVNEKTFNQRSLVHSGDTLVIAGFKQLRNEANNAKMFNVPSSQGMNNTNTETMILITPTIIS